VETGFPKLRAEFGRIDGEWLFMGRRGRGVAGLSLAASAGLLGTYVGYPGLRKAHAATTCEVTKTSDTIAQLTEGELRYCLEQVDDNGGGTITFADSANGTIELNDDLPGVRVDSSLTITGNGDDNTIIDGGGTFGGLYFRFFDGTTATVTDIAIQNMNRSDGGAGIRSIGEPSDVEVRNSTFTSNTSASNFGGGGAIYSFDNVTVTNSTFTGNTSASNFGGGGAIRADDVVTVTNSTFTSNTATNGEGGAIYSRDDVTATNSTFTSNTATKGGAIYVLDLSLNFVTVSGNTTSGGSSAAVDSDGDATVTNSIIYGNTGGDVKAGVTLSASYSLFSSSSSVSPALSGSSLIFGEDPLLGSLADNGGPTQTMLPAAGSPVIGTANPVGAPSTDQRGFARTTNGLADMGAVQRAAVAPEPDLSQVPPSWLQAQGREQREASCPPGMAPSWAQWPNEGTGGWTCEYTTWWDVNEGVGGGWVTTPGLRAGRLPTS